MSSSLLRALVVASALVGCGTSNAQPNETFPETPLVTLASNAHLAVEVRTAPSQPPARGELSAQLTVRDAGGAPRDGLTLVVTPWMPSHGHGSAMSPTVTALGDGVYRVDGLYLAMAGAWQLRIDATGPDGFEDHALATFEVR